METTPANTDTSRHITSLGARMALFHKLEAAVGLSRLVRDLSLVAGARLAFTGDVETVKLWERAVKLLTEAQDVIAQVE